MRGLLFLMVMASGLSGGTGSGQLSALREARLDATECYRVRDIGFGRDEAQIFLTDGYLIFGTPVATANGNRRVTAVFSAETEGGDAELLLLPPSHAERASMAKHTGAPNLEEHFSSAVFVFADATYEEILEQIRANPYIKKAPEMGLVMAEKWNGVARNLEGSFGLRLAMDLLEPANSRKAFFAAALAGRHLGAFDLVYEPRSREQLTAGKSSAPNSPAGFDVWTSFQSRSFRARKFEPEIELSGYSIDSTIDPDLKMHCVSRARIKISALGARALPFEITKQMNVTSASIDGVEAEILTNPATRSSIESPYGNDIFLLVPKQPLAAGTEHDVELRHEGKVVTDAGNKMYYVGSRGTWFPSRGMQFSKFDLTFRYPKELDLVASGDLIDERIEGDRKISHRATRNPIRLVGFNLGVYDRLTVKRPGLSIEVCANRSPGGTLPPKPAGDQAWITGTTVNRRPNRDPLPMTAPSPALPSMAERLKALAADVGEVMDFYTSKFGDSGIRTLEVAPVPGRFGQGFPGLIYLSTLAYSPVPNLSERQSLFYQDLLQAHEAAHQWWGNVVTSAGYHDDWVMEALANYSALMFLEKKKGPKVLDTLMQSYRTDLLAKPTEKTAEVGDTVESSGPVVQGTRVDGNWNAVVYGKGSWIVHMLRRKMGDDAFVKMLADLRRQFEDKTLTTEDFRAHCAKFLPARSSDPKLESFFDQWVYGTGIPELKLDYKVTGKGPTWQVTGTVTQTGVGDDFSAEVPVEIQLGRLKPVVLTVRAGTEQASFSTAVKALPSKVAIDRTSILAR
jgi:hypothetical protein